MTQIELIRKDWGREFNAKNANGIFVGVRVIRGYFLYLDYERKKVNAKIELKRR